MRKLHCIPHGPEAVGEDLSRLSVMIILLFWLMTSPVAGQSDWTCSYIFEDSTECYFEAEYTEQPFTIEKKSESEEFVDNVQTPLSADIDGDCIHELFILKESSKPQIIIVDGATGKTLKSIPVAIMAWSSQPGFCLADIDNDGRVEIILAAADYAFNLPELRKRLICYDLDGNVKWISDKEFRAGKAEPFGSPSVADFNRDGKPEVYIFNEIFNGQTGVKLADGSNNGIGTIYVGGRFQGGITIAADLDDDSSDLELAAGYSIYKVRLTNTDSMPGNQMVAYNYNNRLDGYTSVADINNDNKLDVIVSTNTATVGFVYVYTLRNNNCTLVAQGFTRYTRSNKEIGPPVVGRLRRVNERNILVTNPYLLTCLAYNNTTSLQRVWEINTIDGSGHTGISLFDFNNDGLHELIFRDEAQLKIFSNAGNTLKLLGSMPCISWTQKEFPIVVSTDVTGESRICTTCSDVQSAKRGRLTVFGPKEGSVWAPARGIWHQHNYNPLIINDDMTIPVYQENSGVYKNKRYNNFYAQDNTILENGKYLKRASSIYGSIDCINFDSTLNAFRVSFSVTNKAEATQVVSGDLSVSFYDGNPEVDGTFLTTVELKKRVGVGETLRHQIAILDLTDVKQLFMVLNTSRNNSGPLLSTDFSQLECDYSDNVSSLLTPEVFRLQESICTGDSILFFGEYIREKKKYFHTIKGPEGCDEEVYILDLQVSDCPSDCDTPCCVSENENSINVANVSCQIQCVNYDSKNHFMTVTYSVLNHPEAGQSVLNGLPVSLFQGDPLTNGILLETTGTPKVLLPGEVVHDLTFTFEYRKNTQYFLWVNMEEAAPVHSDDFSFIQECDYSDNRVEVPLPDFSEVTETLCYGDTAYHNQQVVLFESEFFDLLQNKNGCDTLVVKTHYTYRNCHVDTHCEENCYKSHIYRISDLGMDSIYSSVDTVADNPFILYYDIDGDCVPEIIISESQKGQFTNNVRHAAILFIDAKTGMTKHKIPTAYHINYPSAYVISDIDFDGVPEIILATTASFNTIENSRRLICYNLDGSIKWRSNETLSWTTVNGSGSPAIADFNQDGIPEVYIGHMIFNAQTGVLLAVGAFSYGLGSSSNSIISVAAQLNGYGNLELAAGHTIYTVDITNINGSSGNIMTPHRLPAEYDDGFTAITDIDDDGILDVVVTTETQYDHLAVYIYNFNNDILNVLSTLYSDITDNSSYTITPAQIYKLTPNGEKSLVIAYNSKMESYQYDKLSNSLIKQWEYPVPSVVSFSKYDIMAHDLNNDGVMELFVYDWNSLKVLNEVNGKIELVDSIYCMRAGRPKVVVDDTQSLVCIPCVESIHWINSGSGYLVYKLKFIGPPEGQKWAPARPIWHQYAYNPLMINDDGTVPQYMQNPATYKNGKYNNFMAQANILDEDGRYPVPAASLYGDITCVRYDIDTETYSVDFTLHNRSDASKSAVGGVPVSFYDGDPLSGGTLLGTEYTTQDIAAGQTSSTMTFTWTSGIPIDRLFMVVNTDKSTLTMDEDADFFTEECDYIDNISQKRLPQILLQSQEICENESYEFYGQTLSKSGIYYHKIPQTNGCDSLIYKLELEVTTVKNTRIETQSCDSYTWNNQTYTDTGEYVFATQSVNGCDSIVTLVLKIFPSQNTALAQSACDSYSWNGKTYTESGVYDYQTETIQGCDSTVTIDLKIHPSYNLTESISACEDYRWQGTTYTESGIYTFATQTAQGCDSVMTLELTITDVLRTTESVTACDTYRWNGGEYTTDGQYEYTTLSSLGCDSIVTLDLKIYPSQTTTLSQSACDTYFWNGQTYTTSGVYDYHTETIHGCDSTVTIDLKIHPSYNLTESISACEEYRWQGTTYTESGIYTFATQTAQGCDSVMTLELTITDVLRTTESVTACDTYRWNGQEYTTDGQYEYTTLSSLGCDSIVTLDLKIYPSQSTALSLTTCDSIEYNNEILREAGLYTFAFTTIHGCDSIVSVDLEITSQSIKETREDCDSYTWSQSGLTYDTSGLYAQSFTNIWGCDSTYQLQLTIHPSYDVRMEAERCGSYLWTAQGKTYDESGTYVLPLKTAQGCDSLLTLDLKIHPEYAYRDTIITDTEYTWPINQTTYTESGQYLAEYTTENACDSIYHLYLTIRRAETGMYFPNILRPNGPNSHFTVYTNDSGLTIKRMSVYDRWGGLMFQRDNFEPNDPQSGWNGTFDGRQVVPGVYVWMITMEDKDGKEMVYTGDVTVVR